MFITASLAVGLVALSTFTHYEVLHLSNVMLPHVTFGPRRLRVLLAMVSAMFSHIVHIALFAVAYFFLQDRFGLGALGGMFQNAFSSFLYFSIETYTSLGFGDIYPFGQIRLIVGIEALTGLLMIGWTASFTYFEMSRYWRWDP